jgi:protein-disulfide isomerase
MQNSAKIHPRLVVGGAALALALGFGGGFLFRRAPASDDIQAKPVRAPMITATDSSVRYRIPVSEAQPQHGAKDALVTVVEWCDLRGDACRQADKVQQELLREYDGRLRWAYRHLIDVSHFADSHHMHAFARGAMELPEPEDPQKFWQIREQLLALPGEGAPGESELRRIAGQVGVDYEAIEKGIVGKLYAGNLSLDTAFSTRYGVEQGPGFFVNGRSVGALDEATMKSKLKALIDEEMTAAQRLVESGVAKSAVYDELTKDGLWAINEDRSKRPAPRLMSQSRPQP